MLTQSTLWVLYAVLAIVTGSTWYFWKRGRSAVLAAAALLFSLLAALAAAEKISLLGLMPGVGAWLLAVGLILAAGWKSPSAPDDQPPFIDREILLTAALLSALACLVRMFNLENIPAVLSGDEAASGLYTLDFITGKAQNLFSAGWYDYPSLYFYLQSRSILLFGQTSFALRFSSALVGGLTAGALYLLARRMFDERTALFAAIFLIGSHFHNHFSRFGLHNVWDGLFYTAALGWLWHAWQTGSRRSFVLAGLSLGFAQYFYAGSRGLWLLVPAWLIVLVLSDRSRFKANRAGIALLFTAALTIFEPLAVLYIKNPAKFQAAFSRVTLLNSVSDAGSGFHSDALQVFLNQLLRSAGGLVTVPTRFFYMPDVPILRPAAALIFGFGLLLLLWKIKQPRSLLMLLWLAAVVGMGAFSDSAPASQRYVAVVPACAVLIGWALSQGVDWLGEHLPEARKYLPMAALLLVLVLSLDDLRFYYLDFTKHHAYGGYDATIAQHIVNQVREEQDPWQIAFFGSPKLCLDYMPTIRFLLPQHEFIDMPENWDPLGGPPLLPTNVLFVFLPGHEPDLAKVLKAAPAAVFEQEKDLDDELLYWYIRIPPE